MTEMQSCLPVADEGCVRNHRERDCSAIGKLQIDHLIVRDVVVRLIDAETVWAGFECFGNILNVRNAIN